MPEVNYESAMTPAWAAHRRVAFTSVVFLRRLFFLSEVRSHVIKEVIGVSLKEAYGKT